MTTYTLALLSLTSSVFADVALDFGNSTISSDQNRVLIQRSPTNVIQFQQPCYREGWNVTLNQQTGSTIIMNSQSPWISGGDRGAGGRAMCLATEVNNVVGSVDTTADPKQRCEYLPETVSMALNSEYYLGMSVRFVSGGTWQTPNSWFNLMQLRDTNVPSPRLSNFLLQANTNGRFAFYASGGATTGGAAYTVDSGVAMQADVWYDIIIGFKYNPVSTTGGFTRVWMKKSTEANYVMRMNQAMAMGYVVNYNSGTQRGSLNFIIGQYRSSANNFSSRVLYDNVKRGPFFTSVRPDQF